ncbi:SMI1/KNR4 family protein [Mechercharimyces sp. CAU 1602]|uniref:SMI1/KNR4 family protein n=1 Tax=Mechercharimyces sp. CAU 1602 TaxID=2973933 RepID=UPI0021637488|nr:SMI1/KNR4 family protein [Mechercharimyces sp. CAU 1602]MCS1351696.1 SMI1/KNR4 family protein [Mechercharimyces sp. CAU 1602]
MEWEHTKPVSLETIYAVERKVGFKFPQDFIDCASRNNGGMPEPHVFDLGSVKEKVFGALFDFNDSGKNFSVYEAYETAIEEHGLPTELFPFADDPSGDFFCFDYRSLENGEPIIVLYDHEREYDPENEKDSLRKVANSLSEFLSMMYDPEN